MKIEITQSNGSNDVNLDEEALALSEDELAAFITDAISDLQNLVLSLSANNDHA